MRINFSCQEYAGCGRCGMRTQRSGTIPARSAVAEIATSTRGEKRLFNVAHVQRFMAQPYYLPICTQTLLSAVM
jgi:hypothetical protein